MKKLLAPVLLLSLATHATAGGGAAPMTGSAAQVQAATPAALFAALKEAGYKVTMDPAKPDSDPSMTVVAGDYEVSIWLSSCKANVCGRVTASTYWDYADKKADLDSELTNDWNSNYYTQAYIYEDSYYLDSTMPIRGGYTKATLKAWMTEYLEDVHAFADELK